MISTSVTSSGNATALGNLTACVVLLVNSLVVTMAGSLYLQKVYPHHTRSANDRTRVTPATSSAR